MNEPNSPEHPEEDSVQCGTCDQYIKVTHYAEHAEGCQLSEYDDFQARPTSTEIKITHGEVFKFKQSRFQGHASPIRRPEDVALIIESLRSRSNYRTCSTISCAFRVLQTSSTWDDGSIRDDQGVSRPTTRDSQSRPGTEHSSYHPGFSTDSNGMNNPSVSRPGTRGGSVGALDGEGSSTHTPPLGSGGSGSRPLTRDSWDSYTETPLMREGCSDGDDVGAGDKLLYLLQRWDVFNVVLLLTRWDAGNARRLGQGRHRVGVQCAKNVLEQCYLQSLAASTALSTAGGGGGSRGTVLTGLTGTHPDGASASRPQSRAATASTSGGGGLGGMGGGGGVGDEHSVFSGMDYADLAAGGDGSAAARHISRVVQARDAARRLPALPSRTTVAPKPCLLDSTTVPFPLGHKLTAGLPQGRKRGRVSHYMAPPTPTQKDEDAFKLRGELGGGAAAEGSLWRTYGNGEWVGSAVGPSPLLLAHPSVNNFPPSPPPRADTPPAQEPPINLAYSLDMPLPYPNLSRDNLQRLLSLQAPPPLVLRTLECVSILLGRPRPLTRASLTSAGSTRSSRTNSRGGGGGSLSRGGMSVISGSSVGPQPHAGKQRYYSSGSGDGAGGGGPMLDWGACRAVLSAPEFRSDLMGLDAARVPRDDIDSVREMLQNPVFTPHALRRLPPGYPLCAELLEWCIAVVQRYDFITTGRAPPTQQQQQQQQPPAAQANSQQAQLRTHGSRGAAAYTPSSTGGGIAGSSSQRQAFPIRNQTLLLQSPAAPQPSGGVQPLHSWHSVVGGDSASLAEGAAAMAGDYSQQQQRYGTGGSGSFGGVMATAGASIAGGNAAGGGVGVVSGALARSDARSGHRFHVTLTHGATQNSNVRKL